MIAFVVFTNLLYKNRIYKIRIYKNVFTKIVLGTPKVKFAKIKSRNSTKNMPHALKEMMNPTKKKKKKNKKGLKEVSLTLTHSLTHKS